MIGIRRWLPPISPLWQFVLASFAVVLAGTLMLGWWLGQQIAWGVIRQTGATTALYITGVVAPHLEEFDRTGALSADHFQHLSQQSAPALRDPTLLRLWGPDGRIVFSSDPREVDAAVPAHGNLQRAWAGEVISTIDTPEGEAGAQADGRESIWLEVYAPLYAPDSRRVIAVAEYYHEATSLLGEIRAAQWRSWLAAGGLMAAVYLLLVGLAWWSDRTIGSQQKALHAQVEQLTQLLGANQELSRRVRQAAANTAAINEHLLCRTSAELHDGPAQELSLALLQVDRIGGALTGCQQDCPYERPPLVEVEAIHRHMRYALDELRQIAGGLGLPRLEPLTLAETVNRVVHIHQRRTGTQVSVQTDGLPEQAPLPVKVIVYRFIQEGLSNAQRHAGGLGQRVRLRAAGGSLEIEVSDQGAGMEPGQSDGADGRLGLEGMRQRVESLGGVFRLRSAPGQGTTVLAQLPLETARSIPDD